jgi:eukaryotic-like serine/threonine-protein kinase
MGIVFLARDVALDRLVAIKLLPPSMAAQPSLRERFLREARTAAKLSHPNIIPIYAVEQLGDLVFFVMAFVDGETLGQRLRTRGALPARDVTRLLQEVAWALAYAHLRGIVHRDIKPDNILIESATGRALVSDFGIARATDTSGGTQIGEVLGTAQYMSPEQACGETVDGRSDLYSLGVVGFYAVSGRLPFDAPDIPALLAQHITKPAAPVARVQPAVPKKLAEVIDRCLLKDPAQRFQTGEQLAEALAQETAVTRETPAPVRVWLTAGTAARGVLVAWTVLIGIGTLVEVIQWLLGNEALSETLENVAFLVVPWGLYGTYRAIHTRRLMAAGYGYEDLRLALRQHLEQRREELAFEYDRDPSLLGRIIRYVAFGGVALVGISLAYALTVPLPDPETWGFLLAAGAMAAVGGAGLGMLIPGRRLSARDRLLEWRNRLMDSRLGRWLFRVSTLGLRRGSPAVNANRPTAVAIGLAGEALFEALPKETRRRLKELPAVLRRLEADAAAYRARVDELTAMLAGPLDMTGSQSLQADGGAAAGVVAEHQAKLRAELESQRDAAARRMAAAVAALENLRLDLLRLKAGLGTVAEISADLSAAHALQQDIDFAIESQREIRHLLAEATPKPQG